MRRGTYVGGDLALKRKRALVQLRDPYTPEAPGSDSVWAQFDGPKDLWRCGDFSADYPLCFGWHKFAQDDFLLDAPIDWTTP